MPVEFWWVYNPDNSHCVAVIEDGEIIEDSDDWLKEEMEFHPDYDWTDAEFLLRRYDGPGVLAIAKGDDEKRLRQLGWTEYGSPGSLEKRANQANMKNESSQGVIYYEVGGDGEYPALGITQARLIGEWDTVEPENSEIELLLSIYNGDQSIPLVSDSNLAKSLEDDIRANLRQELDGTDSIRELIALRMLNEMAAERPSEAIDYVPILTDLLEGDEETHDYLILSCLNRLASEYPRQLVPATAVVMEHVSATSDGRIQGEAIPFLAKIADVEADAVLDAVPTLAAIIADGSQHNLDAILTMVRVARFHPEAILPVVDDLIDRLKDEQEEHRVVTFAAIGFVAKEYPNVAESTIPVAEELLNSPEDHLRANAAAMLADLADEYHEEVRKSIPRVIELLDDNDENARYNATSILAKLSKYYPDAVEPAIDGLIGALDEHEPYARSNASWALGQLRVSRAKDKLESTAAEDPHEEVRANAEWALDQL